MRQRSPRYSTLLISPLLSPVLSCPLHCDAVDTVVGVGNTGGRGRGSRVSDDRRAGAGAVPEQDGRRL